MVNELRTTKQTTIMIILNQKWYSWFKELYAAKKPVKGDNNFNSDIKFIIKSLNLFSAGDDNPLLDRAITIPEIKRAGRKLKNNKACGQ